MGEKTEGQRVREAFDGPQLEHDQMINQFADRSAEEYARASDSSESSAKTTEFLNETGMNSQAFSWLKAIYKKLPKKDGQSKAMDVIRSLEAGLPLLKNHVQGQSTLEMNLDGPDDAETKPVDEQEPAGEGQEAPDAELSEDEPPSDDFDDQADSVYDEQNVVTPIDFGGATA